MPLEHRISILRFLIIYFLSTAIAEIKIAERNIINTQDEKNVRTRRQVVGPDAKRWPNRTIFYEIDSSLLELNAKQNIEYALSLWSSKSCLSFQENPTGLPRIQYRYRLTGNGSIVGAPGDSDTRLVHILNHNMFGIIAHETGHALGLHHAHQRLDRAEHLQVHSSNIVTGERIQYQPLAGSRTFGVPYDHGSLMHYPAGVAGCKDGTKGDIATKDPLYKRVIGCGQEGEGIAFTDYLILNHFYKCKDVCKGMNGPVCYKGGFRNPKDCSKCVCPSGFHGTDCSQASNGKCGRKISLASTAVKTFDETASSAEGCSFHIRVPQGKVIKLVVTGVIGPECDRFCRKGYAEIKIGSDMRATGVRFCCPEDLDYFNRQRNVLVSESHRVVVILSPKSGQTRLVMNYRMSTKNGSTTDNSALFNGANTINNKSGKGMSRKGTNKSNNKWNNGNQKGGRNNGYGGYNYGGYNGYNWPYRNPYQW